MAAAGRGSTAAGATGARRGEAGFTIVELGFVVAVIVVLAVIVLASTGGIRGTSRGIECHDELRRLKVAMANYHAVTEHDPESTDVLVQTRDPVRGGHYLAAAPKWYRIGPNGVIAPRGLLPTSCPRPTS